MRLHHLVAGGAIGLGAFLLFLLEPMASKELLPVHGGSSAVWLACLTFFQIALLVGYSYAALLCQPTLQRAAPMLHAVALALAVSWTLFWFTGPPPVSLHAAPHPAWAIFTSLTRRVGLPFLLLSATSPLVQVWLSRLDGRAVRFRLFALSNAGSLLALLAFPAWLEPGLSLTQQRRLWVCGFVLYALLSGALTLFVARQRDIRVRESEAQIASPAIHSLSPRRIATWFLLAAVGSLQLCTITSHLTENVAAIPLLWIVPLALYLCSFILAFEAPALYRQPVIIRLLVVLLASLGYLLSKTDVSLPMGASLAFFLAEMFIACWFCHAELYRLRPQEQSRATSFYLVLAAGGAAGTAAIALFAPIVFDANYDLPLAFACTSGAVLLVTWPEGWSQRLLWTVSTCLCLVLAGRLHTAYARNSLFMTRNFYGSLRVKQSELPAQSGGSRVLLHGTIEHGTQWFSPSFRRRPTTYYGETSGAGVALTLCCKSGPRSVGIIGLGAGTLAAYGHAGDTFRFYELNPRVPDVAKGLFTYLRESPASVSVVEGDARQSLQFEADQHFDVLVVDAFSGDAIPVHLLTLQAMRLYQRHLKPTGVLAFHISNQYLDLAPALASTASAAGLQTRLIDSAPDVSTGVFAARWVLAGGLASTIFLTPGGPPGSPMSASTLRPWTDDYSSLLPLVRWSGSAR